MTGRSKIKISSEDFRVKPGSELKPSDRPTDVKSICKSKKQYKKLLDEHVEALQRSTASALCFKSLRAPADLSGDGCRGQGWGHPPRHVGDQSAGLRCSELQAT